MYVRYDFILSFIFYANAVQVINIRMQCKKKNIRYIYNYNVQITITIAITICKLQLQLQYFNIIEIILKNRNENIEVATIFEL